MSKKQKKKSNENGDISDNKVSYPKLSINKVSTIPSSQKSNQKDEAEDVGSSCAKEQSTNQRLSDSAGYRKLQSCVDHKYEISKKTQPFSGNLVPTEARRKVVMHFKSKTEPGKMRNSMISAIAFPRKESSNIPMLDAEAKKGKAKYHHLGILNTTEKKKKEFKLESTKVKETIVKNVLEKKKNKNLLKHEFKLKQNISKKPSHSLTDAEVLYQSDSVCKPERTKTLSLELPGKSGKEIINVPLSEPSRCWKYKQKEQPYPGSTKNIVNRRTQGSPSEHVAFQTSQQLKTSSHSSPWEAVENPVVDQEMQIVEELHAARIDKKMALPVVQACGELTSMEIDLPDSEASMSAKIPSDLSSLIVIDTNIMISHLSFIKSLKNTDIPGIGRFVLVIPWVVLQELDNLKKGKILANVGQQAVPAVHFIYTCLKSQDPKLWGQSMQLASQKTCDLCIENNDDRVLQCCLQYKNLFPRAEVILLTDDKNLCSKALVSEIKAFCKADFALALRKEVGKAVLLSHNNSCDQSQSKKADPRSEKNKVNTTALLSVITLELKTVLHEVLSSILEAEMKIAFGDLWPEVVYHKPPWTLTQLLECYKKHWMAVFGLIVSRDLLSTIEYLDKQLCKAKVTELPELEEVLSLSQVLLGMFSSRSDYDGALPKGLAQVNKLLQSLEKIQSGTEQDISNSLKSTSESVACEQMEEMVSAERREEEKSLLVEPSAHGDRHLEIWSVLESAWMKIIQFRSDVFQKLDLSTVVATQSLSSFKEGFIDLQKLMAAVNEIITGIRQILMPNSGFQDVWQLYNFLTNNKINNTKFTAEELYDCVSQKVYRDRLSVGCEQLLQLECSIKQCYETVCMEIQNRGWI